MPRSGGIAARRTRGTPGHRSNSIVCGESGADVRLRPINAEFKAGLAEVRAEIAGLDTRFSTEIAGVRTEIAALDTRLSTQIGDVRTEIANLETRLIRWMVGTVIATATLTVGILRLVG